MKRESEIIDADLYQGGKIYLLVENVQSLVFKYWDEKTEKWVDEWNSDNGQYKDKFPPAVQISVSAKGEGGEVLSITTAVKIAFPNIVPKKYRLKFFLRKL